MRLEDFFSFGRGVVFFLLWEKVGKRLVVLFVLFVCVYRGFVFVDCRVRRYDFM